MYRGSGSFQFFLRTASSTSSTKRSIVCAVGVDHDAVAVGDERDRTAVDRLGRDVPDAEALGAAGEPAVGDERGVVAPARSLHRTGDREHLAHPGPPFGPS